MRLSGSAIMDASVETVVMATESGKSAFAKEHHQFDKEPPGEDVVTSRSTAYSGFILKL